MAAFATTSDLEIALGGASQLVQLADYDKDGTADSAVVTDFLESQAGEIRSVIEVKYEPEAIAALDAASSRLLRDINKWKSARQAWLEGGRGQAVPARVQQEADRSDQMLMEIRTGERRLGRVAGGGAPALAQPIGVVDHDSDGSRVSIQAFRTYGYR